VLFWLLLFHESWWLHVVDYALYPSAFITYVNYQSFAMAFHTFVALINHKSNFTASTGVNFWKATRETAPRYQYVSWPSHCGAFKKLVRKVITNMFPIDLFCTENVRKMLKAWPQMYWMDCVDKWKGYGKQKRRNGRRQTVCQRGVHSERAKLMELWCVK